MNLRLRPDVAAALRAESERSGRSQQEILREAVDRYLNIPPPRAAETVEDPLVAGGVVLSPRSPYRRVEPGITLPPPATSLDLLDRDDRI